MLTKDLLRYRVDGKQINPAFLNPKSPRYRQTVSELFRTFRQHVGKTCGELEEAIEKNSASRTDYRVIRGLAKILMNYTMFEAGRTDSAMLRSEVFLRAAEGWPLERRKSSAHETDRQTVLDEVAGMVGLTSAQLDEELYADLPDRRRMIQFEAACDPGAIIVRYNMELARGLLYWAEQLVIEIEDSYQDVIRFIKLCRLMHHIIRLDRGYRIELDGPLSLLRGTRRYGFKMAVFLPALALCRTWKMQAIIVRNGERLTYSLDDRSELVSHFRRFPLFDSKLESDFAADFEKTLQRHSVSWSLSRADAVISVGPNEVMIPDFTLRHQNGQQVYLEIVGFWTPEYLEGKIAKVRKANLGNLILAISKQLALSESVAEGFNIIWFAKKLSARDVLERADLLIEGTSMSELFNLPIDRPRRSI
jgi:predicted nuclease of restriction endonuclease-like RecB superfamily